MVARIVDGSRQILSGIIKIRKPLDIGATVTEGLNWESDINKVT